MANKTYKSYLKKVTHLSLKQIKSGVILLEDPPAQIEIAKPKKLGKKPIIELDFEKEPIEGKQIDLEEE